MVQKRARVGAVMAAASISDFGMDCKPARKTESCGNLFPHSGHHDQSHGVLTVEQVVPLNAILRKPYATTPMDVENMNATECPPPRAPPHRKDQNCLVESRALDDAVRKDGQYQCNAQPQAGDQHGKTSWS